MGTVRVGELTASYGRVRSDGAKCHLVSLSALLPPIAYLLLGAGLGLWLGQVHVPARYQSNALLAASGGSLVASVVALVCLAVWQV
jgi:hypothetical protein